jgi:hypothetical protein
VSATLCFHEGAATEGRPYSPFDDAQSTRRTLDRHHSGPYSLPFRTNSLKQQTQRPVGSVGVEALPDRK